MPSCSSVHSCRAPSVSVSGDRAPLWRRRPSRAGGILMRWSASITRRGGASHVDLAASLCGWRPPARHVAGAWVVSRADGGAHHMIVISCWPHSRTYVAVVRFARPREPWTRCRRGSRAPRPASRPPMHSPTITRPGQSASRRRVFFIGLTISSSRSPSGAIDRTSVARLRSCGLDVGTIVAPPFSRRVRPAACA